MRQKQFTNFNRNDLIKDLEDSLKTDLFKQNIYDHWRKYVPLIYDPEFDNPTQLAIDEITVRDILFKPMEYFLCGGNPEEVFCTLKAIDNNTNVCGRVFKNGQPTYTCTDCAADGTCVLCSECFLNSEHKKHKYKIFTSSGGGICDCGDTEAWKNDPFCNLHLSQENSDKTNYNEEILSKLPNGFIIRASTLFLTTIQYSVLMLCWHNPLELPESLIPQIIPDKYVTMLYNDEVHTYEQVINTLMRAIDCSHKEGVEFATTVDREGRSPVLIGQLFNCERVRATIEKTTSRHGGKPLKAEVFHSLIVAHQRFAYKLLIWMNYIVNQSKSLRYILCNMAIQPFSVDDVAHSSLEQLILHDTQIWKLARMKCHELFMSNMLMFPDTKRKFASTFTQHYSRILDDYMDDDQEHLASISCLSVQLFTVPSVARYLIIHKNVLSVVIETFIRVCQPYKNADGKLSFDRNQPNNTFRRGQYVLNDLHYLLLSPPKPVDWVEPLKKHFLNGFNSMLNLLCSMQNMDCVVRQVGQHLDYEPEWETAFNVMYKIIPCLNSFEAWIRESGQSDCIVKTVGRVLKALYRLNKKFKYVTLLPKYRSIETNLNLNVKAKVIKYDVSDDEVSVHIPVTRLFTGLYLQLRKYNLSYYSPEFDYNQSSQQVPTSQTTCQNSSMSSDGTFMDTSTSDISTSSNNTLTEQTTVSDMDIVNESNEIPLIPSKDVKSEQSFFKKFNLKKDSIINKDYSKIPTPLELAEFPLRTLVLSAQVQAGMWKRNGYSLLNQVYLYHNAKWRHQMFDRDIMALQIVASLIIANGNDTHVSSSSHSLSQVGNADVYLLNLLNKYDLVSFTEWINLKLLQVCSSLRSHHEHPFVGPKDFAEEEEHVKLKTVLMEEFLHLVIVLTNERYNVEVGQVSEEEVMQREIIHQLCIGPLSHSELVKTLPEKEAKSSILENVLFKVAHLKKSIDATSKTKYHLKREYYTRFDPFYYHYTKSEQSKAEEFKKLRKLETLDEKACAPPRPPKFKDHLNPITTLLDSDLLIHILDLLLTAAKYSNYPNCTSSQQNDKTIFPVNPDKMDIIKQLTFVTDLMIHEILHLLCLMFYNIEGSENNNLSFDTFAKLVKAKIPQKISCLLNNPKSESYYNLVLFTLQLYDKLEETRNPTIKQTIPKQVECNLIKDTSINHPISNPGMCKSLSTGTDATTQQRKKKGDIAKARRQKILSKMNKAQKCFIKTNKDLWDSIPSATTVPITSKEEELLGESSMLRDGNKQNLISETLCNLHETQRESMDLFRKYHEMKLAAIAHEFSEAVEPHKIGISGLGVQSSEPQTMTCILCQEEQILSNDTESLVIASYVQNSTVLKRNVVKRSFYTEPGQDLLGILDDTLHSNNSVTDKTKGDPRRTTSCCVFPQDSELKAFLASDIFLARGVVVKTCGHVMHARCWHRFYDAVVTRERRHALRFRFHHTAYDVEKNEYLCPLCNVLSNTTLPILPPILVDLGNNKSTLGNLSPKSNFSRFKKPGPHEFYDIQKIPLEYWLKLTNALVRMSIQSTHPSKSFTKSSKISSKSTAIDAIRSSYPDDWKHLLRTRDLDKILKLFTDNEMPYKDQFREIFSGLNGNNCNYTSSINNLANPDESEVQQETESVGLISPASTIEDTYSASILSMLKTFSTSLHTIALDVNPSNEDNDLPLLIWNACSYTIQSLDVLMLSSADTTLSALLPTADTLKSTNNLPMMPSFHEDPQTIIDEETSTSQSHSETELVNVNTKLNIPDRYTDCIRYLVRYSRTFTAHCSKANVIKHHALMTLQQIFASLPPITSTTSTPSTSNAILNATFGLLPSNNLTSSTSMSSAKGPYLTPEPIYVNILGEDGRLNLLPQNKNSSKNKDVDECEMDTGELINANNNYLESLNDLTDVPAGFLNHSFILDNDMFSTLVKLCFSFHAIFDQTVSSTQLQSSDIICTVDESDYFILQLLYIAQIVQILLFYPGPSVPLSPSNQTGKESVVNQQSHMDVDADMCVEKADSDQYDFSDVPSTSKNIFWEKKQKHLPEPPIKNDASGMNDDEKNGILIPEEVERDEADYIYNLWVKFKEALMPVPEIRDEAFDSSQKEVKFVLLKHLRTSLLPFLRCCAIFFHYLTDVALPTKPYETVKPLFTKPISNTDISYFVPLCQYHGLPIRFKELFQSGGPRLLDTIIIDTWLKHPKVTKTLMKAYMETSKDTLLNTVLTRMNHLRDLTATSGGKLQNSIAPSVTSHPAKSFLTNISTNSKLPPTSITPSSHLKPIYYSATMNTFLKNTISYPLKCPKLIKLPKDYADLIILASNFVCPNANQSNTNKNASATRNTKSALTIPNTNLLNPLNNLLNSAIDVLRTVGHLPYLPNPTAVSTTTTNNDNNNNNQNTTEITIQQLINASSSPNSALQTSLILLRDIFVGEHEAYVNTENTTNQARIQDTTTTMATAAPEGEDEFEGTTNITYRPLTTVAATVADNMNAEMDRLGIPINPESYLDIDDNMEDDDELLMFHDSSCTNSGSRAPTLCLICGKIVCSQSYCCQSELIFYSPASSSSDGSDATRANTFPTIATVGACTAHAYTCGAGIGMFLRIRECQILLLNGRSKGTFYVPPYIDAYGETDQGFRRGNPLFLCPERFADLEKMWLSNSIPDEIARSLETNPNLLSIDWQHL